MLPKARQLSPNKICPSHIIISMFAQLILNITAFGTAESRSIMEFTLQQTCFASQQFKRFAHGHTRWKTVRVHNHIGRYTSVVEWHVFLFHYQPGDTFLTVARAKFVTDFRAPRLSQQNFD